MLRGLIEEVQKLFSSKKNGARLIAKETDKFHYYKQFLLAIGIAILVGYSQFRSHFECSSFAKHPESKWLTNHCYINGTYTVIIKKNSDLITDHEQQVDPEGEADIIDESDPEKRHRTYVDSNTVSGIKSQAAHVGLNFDLDPRKFQLVSHNYTRNAWVTLVILALFSYVAQRHWASIYRNDTMIALLKLPGYQELATVKKAQQSKPFDRLKRLPDPDQNNKPPTIELGRFHGLFEVIDAISGNENEYAYNLHYYPNQLIYLLLARKSATYKFSELKLRSRLIWYAICSFLMTLAQVLTPIYTIKKEYILYGWNYLMSWFEYNRQMWTEPEGSEIHAIDYELSARLWPTLTVCPFSFNDVNRKSLKNAICIIPIHEICSKIFAILWWFLAVNLLVELYAVLWIVSISFNHGSVAWTLGKRFWPHCRKEANQIATFRYRHRRALERLEPSSRESSSGHITNSFTLSTSSCDEKHNLKSQEASRSPKRLHKLSVQNLSSWMNRAFGRLCCWGKRSYHGDCDEDGFREHREDVHLYFFFYVLYMRLGGNQKKIEQVIRMTANALERYITIVERIDKSQFEQSSSETGSSVISQLGPTAITVMGGDGEFQTNTITNIT